MIVSFSSTLTESLIYSQHLKSGEFFSVHFKTNWEGRSWFFSFHGKLLWLENIKKKEKKKRSKEAQSYCLMKGDILYRPHAISVTFAPQSSATSWGRSSSLNELCPSCPYWPEPNVNTAPVWGNKQTNTVSFIIYISVFFFSKSNPPINAILLFIFTSYTAQCKSFFLFLKLKLY